MYVNGVNAARVDETEYQDGWFRTFRKNDIPKFTKQEKELLREYMDSGQVEEMLIYMDKFRDLDEEVSSFVVREFMRGKM